ncbi:hypothetical protein C357_19571, partial [Citreicella sp. 357]
DGGGSQSYDAGQFAVRPGRRGPRARSRDRARRMSPWGRWH